MVRSERLQERWAVRASVVGLFAVLCFLAGFSILTERGVAVTSRNADRATSISAAYQDARLAVAQEKSEERRYRYEPSPRVLAAHRAAENRLLADLRRVRDLGTSPHTEATVLTALQLQFAYRAAGRGLFTAIDQGHRADVDYLEHEVIDPTYGRLEDLVSREAAAASAAALAYSASVRSQGARAVQAIKVAFGLGIALLLTFFLVLIRFRRRHEAARAAELERLGTLAMTDPLTGLRNHRAFHEDLARELQRVARTQTPLALAVVDVDDLKTVNDDEGLQAGDDLLQALAEAIRATERGADCAYRVGGDEFAIILAGSRAYGALEFVQRLQGATRSGAHGAPFSISAGISEALTLRAKDDVVREATLALAGAVRINQDAAVYGPDLERVGAMAGGEDGHHRRTLASALARAVDAKDSYTRSHCQTVSQLCAIIAAELGLQGERLARMRLAGLLHDVGKIGVPDAILNKPAALTDAEYEVMKRHSELGYDIVRAADMPLEAEWIRHHHERFDGRGYPDGLPGEGIPLESRIILVADAFEAMTSDRPYRRAPGPEFAVQELRRHAGTQFDPDVVAALCRVLDRVAVPAALAVAA